MSTKLGASEQEGTNGTAVPILAEGIGTRIKAAADKIGSRKKAAKAAGVSDDMLYKYIRETSAPSFSAMVGLCAESGFSLVWMATGEGPMTQAGNVQEARNRYFHQQPAPAVDPAMGSGKFVVSDFDVLEEVIVKTRMMFEQKGIELRPEAEAKVIRLIYEYHYRHGDAMDEATLDNVIELARFR